MKLRMGGFLLPSVTAPPEEIEKGFAGQNPNFYQRGLRDGARLIRQLEELGFDFVAFSEHHFHVEGLEVSNNPILLGSWAAGLTKTLRIGQMGTVLPARNPILVAEDLAMLDHFSEGRMFAGFARGYQARHVRTIGQKYNAFSTAPNDPEYQEHDRINRELFQENIDIIRRAWREPLFSHHGEHWDIPPKGISWDHPATRRLAQGMVDARGEVTQIGIAPQTLQDPDAIEIMVPFTMSAETIEWCAREDARPILFTPIPEYVRGALDGYHKAANEAGRDVPWGAGVGHFREIVVADTDEEAEYISDQGLGYVWTSWHDWFGFNEALRRPGEQGAIPNTAASVRERGYSMAGSIDTVARKLEAMLELTKTELLVPWIFQGPAPIDGLLRSNELLVERVLPKIGVELERREPTLRAGATERWRH